MFGRQTALESVSRGLSMLHALLVDRGTLMASEAFPCILPMQQVVRGALKCGLDDEEHQLNAARRHGTSLHSLRNTYTAAVLLRGAAMAIARQAPLTVMSTLRYCLSQSIMLSDTYPIHTGAQ